MGKIVAAGGGHWRAGERYETAVFDRRIIELARKSTPNFLYIGWAKEAGERHFEVMEEIFGGMYGCETAELTDGDAEDREAAARKIEWADIIFVGGGNTSKLMKRFRKSRVDQMLAAAYEADKVLCGVSAGAMCWCRYGNSATGPSGPGLSDIVRVEGLGLLDILFCPHSAQQKRIDSMPEMLAQSPYLTAFMLDNAALEVSDGKFRILRMENGARASICRIIDGEYVEELISGQKCGSSGLPKEDGAV